MPRVCDYIADFVYKSGVDQIFMVSGGGMMFLSDGVASHPSLEAVCTHHEQAAAMAAVGYAKFKGSLGVCYVTTGCGGTNAVTGLLNAWQDSAPCLFISGQCKRKETIRNSGLRLRQFGVQEADIISIVESLTKYAVMVSEPESIAYHLERAAWLATNGRPGPVWLDIPMDVQSAVIDETHLLHFNPDECPGDNCPDVSARDVELVIELIRKADRPIIVAGQGVRLADAIDEFRQFVEKFRVPFAVSKLGVDLIPSAHPLFVGRIGTKGDRAGNFAVQNSDLVLSIGCRLSVSSTGHEYSSFAREARLIVVDIDPVEHKKGTVRIDHFIHSDAKLFLTKMNQNTANIPRTSWLEKCAHWKKKFPVCLPEYADDSAGINLHYFVDCLSAAMPGNAAVVCDAGSSFFVVTQVIKLRQGQRCVASGGQAEMGFTIPGAIGVCCASNRGEVIGITGDGSFQMNIQELQTIVHYKMPVKIFVWNNDGYLSIRATQSKFFENRFIGTDKSSGVSFPEIAEIAKAYRLPYHKLSKSARLSEQIEEILNMPGPSLTEVICIRDQEIVPTASSLRKADGTIVSKPLEDMYPFLDRETFDKEMIVKPLKE